MKNQIAIIVSSPMMINFFLLGQISTISKYFDVTIITNIKSGTTALKKNVLPNRVKIINVRLEREIYIMSDLLALIKLFKIFRRAKYDIVHSISLKAGLLTQVSARIAGTPIRLHTFTGQLWAVKTGFARYLFRLVDVIIVRLASMVLLDSYAQRSFLISEGVLNHDNSSVLMNGSISGVDSKVFKPSPEIYHKFRKDMGLKSESKIIIFIGRLTQDKGILDLIQAFDLVCKDLQDLHLILVGPDEGEIIKKVDLMSNNRSSILFYDYTQQPEYYMQVSDILCLPSYREGFGNVIIEAAMCGIPSITSSIYGLKDAVENNRTGATFNVGDIDELSYLIKDLINNEEKRLRMGRKALIRAQNFFSSDIVNNELIDFYKSQLKNNQDKVA